MAANLYGRPLDRESVMADFEKVQWSTFVSSNAYDSTVQYVPAVLPRGAACSAPPSPPSAATLTFPPPLPHPHPPCCAA